MLGAANYCVPCSEDEEQHCTIDDSFFDDFDSSSDEEIADNRDEDLYPSYDPWMILGPITMVHDKYSIN